LDDMVSLLYSSACIVWDLEVKSLPVAMVSRCGKCNPRRWEMFPGKFKGLTLAEEI
jgi:hypothetical protein